MLAAGRRPILAVVVSVSRAEHGIGGRNSGVATGHLIGTTRVWRKESVEGISASHGDQDGATNIIRGSRRRRTSAAVGQAPRENFAEHDGVRTSVGDRSEPRSFSSAIAVADGIFSNF